MKITEKQIEELKKIDSSIKDSVIKIQEFEKKYGKINISKLIEEKKTLSDKHTCHISEGYKEEDVKDKLKEFIEKVDAKNVNGIGIQSLQSIAKEIFGDKLI